MGMFDKYFTALSDKGAVATRSDNSLKKEAVKIYDTGETLNPGTDVKTSNLSNWYKQKPYGFRFSDHTFYLPISPSNLTISTHFATNVITTMYGTVEEHSEQRYYDITIAGTTGMSPRYYENIHDQIFDDGQSAVQGRASYPISHKISGSLGGFMKRTQALVENTLNQVSSALSEDDVGTTGIDLRKTGYAAFHNFYKFLLLHKKLVTGQAHSLSAQLGNNVQLYFLNYKDGNQYNVAIQNFQLTRDSTNPMLYNYSITMRAYNLQNVDTKNITGDVSSRLTELGLDGLSTSFAAKLANKARQAKNTAYSAIAATKGFGS